MTRVLSVGFSFSDQLRFLLWNMQSTVTGILKFTDVRDVILTQRGLEGLLTILALKYKPRMVNNLLNNQRTSRLKQTRYNFKR